MEGKNKQKKAEGKALLQGKLRKTRERIKIIPKRKKAAERKLRKLSGTKERIKNQRRKALQKRDKLKKKLSFFDERENQIKSEKEKIEEEEKKEENKARRRVVEKKRWETEERRREVEKKKWIVEDELRKVHKEIREAEKKITEKIKVREKRINLFIRNLVFQLGREKERESFLEKEIAKEKKLEKEKRKEERHGKEEQKEKEGEEKGKKKSEEEKESVLEKEKTEASLDEKTQIDFIKEKVKEEHEKLAARERSLRDRENREEVRRMTKEQLEEERRQRDLIKDRVREEQERTLRVQEEKPSPYTPPEQQKQEIKEETKEEKKEERKGAQEEKPSPYTPPKQQKEEKKEAYSEPRTIVKEIIREKDPAKEDIRKEIEEVMKEKQRLAEQQEVYNKKKEEEREKYFQEVKKKEDEIKNETRKLEEREKETQSDEEREEIRRKKEEMKDELRKLIQEETEGKWEKRFAEIENKVGTINQKYTELNEKEKRLRNKVQEIGTWGPESRRKKKEEAYEYRALYKSPTSIKRLEKEEEKEKEEKKEKKEKDSSKFLKSLSLIKSLRPSKDFFLKQPILTAIDISDYSIEVFSIKEKGGGSFFGRSLLEEGVVYNGEIKDEKKLKKALADTLQKTKLASLKKQKETRVKAILSLPESKVFIQHFKAQEDENILEKVREEIGKNIPIHIEDLYFHYHTISLSEKKEKRILCIAVQKKTVKKYIDILRSLDIDPIVFDLEGASLGRALLSPGKENKKEKEKKKSEMIVDIGARTTVLSVFRERSLSLSVSIPFGGAYFTEKISKALNISVEEAEGKKKSSGLKGETREILIDALEKIVKEIKEAEKHYNREFDSEISNIVLAGGSALIPGALDYFKEELGGIVEIGNPLKKVKEVREMRREEGLLYANAIGLALRSNEKDLISSGFNLLPEEIKKKEKRYQREREGTIRLVALIFAIVGIVALIFSLYYAYTRTVGMPQEKEVTVPTSYDEVGGIVSVYNNPEGEEVIKTISRDDNYEIIHQVGDWTLIEVNDTRGWIRREEHSREEVTPAPSEFTEEAVSVYENPIGEEIITTIDFNEDYEILRQVGDWTLIEVGDIMGWIHNEDI